MSKIIRLLGFVEMPNANRLDGVGDECRGNSQFTIS